MVRVRIRVRFGVKFSVRVRVRPFSRSREVRFWTNFRQSFYAIWYTGHLLTAR